MYTHIQYLFIGHISTAPVEFAPIYPWGIATGVRVVPKVAEVGPTRNITPGAHVGSPS